MGYQKRDRQYNGETTTKGTKRQTMISKTQHRQIKIEQHNPTKYWGELRYCSSSPSCYSSSKSGNKS